MAQPQDRLVVQHAQLALDYVKTDKGWWQYSLNTQPAAALTERVAGLPFPNFQAAVAGRPYGSHAAMVSGMSALPQEMAMERCEREGDRLTLRYKHAALGLAVEVDLWLVPGASVIRSTTTAINESDRPIVLTHLSSLFMQGIATDGLLAWHDPRKIRVHYATTTWEGESQWKQSDLEGLGLYECSVHPESTAFHLTSVGSLSTARFLPMMVIEDRETGKAWFFQIETSSNWHLEISHRGSWNDEKGSLYIHADAADERHLGWVHRLEPGEHFASAPAAVGCCSGGFAEAVRELTLYRRVAVKPPKAWEGDHCPLIFNDYMNALWGQPDREKLVPLIDAAARAGAEAFCIDAGWFGKSGVSWGSGLGVWEPSPDRFGEGGLKGILDTIKSKGMIPGLWLEMEVCGEDTELARTRPDDWFLMRHGRRVGGGPRLFFNFANPEVRAYMHGRIDALVGLGAGYFKNDYNDCVGLGAENLGTTAADGLLAHARAFYTFIDEVRARHPRLIIENCGGGAMRQDNGILAHFHLQSSSDQELYHLYPPIILGSLAAVLPEQLGVWVYPLPLLFPNLKNPAILKTPEYQASMADGEETIFNVVNGLCGNFYLSGRLDAADAANMALIQEGT
ncbi:MAG: alpha-galactosidase, partial [bacterium]|nr:alpha-galactosidase [bacterium]